MGMGRTGVVMEVQGGPGFVRRLDAMGIRPGVSVVKTSAQYMRGPVTVRAGNSHVALGFGMAARIIVETDGEEAR